MTPAHASGEKHHTESSHASDTHGGHLGHAVGHWVLEAACVQARAWREGGVGDIVLGVNLSAGQLRDTSMVADLRQILDRTGCEPAWLQFEITETSMVRDVEGAGIVLAKLRSLGVRAARPQVPACGLTGQRPGVIGLCRLPVPQRLMGVGATKTVPVALGASVDTPELAVRDAGMGPTAPANL